MSKSESTSINLKACHCCGLVHSIAKLSPSQQAKCSRCHSTIACGRATGAQSSARCFAAALGAIFLYFPAVLLPILRVEKLGHRHETSIITGALDLIQHGNFFVGLVVVLFSVVLPLLKLLALLELSFLSMAGKQQQAWVYRVVELAGKWSMMDVLLLALLVTLVKLGDLVHFQLGPAVIAFVLCVAMSLVASMLFDPHSIWEETHVTSINPGGRAERSK